MRFIYYIPDKRPTKRKDIHGRSWHIGTKDQFFKEYAKNWGIEKIFGYYQDGNIGLYITKEYQKKAVR
jgi:hypothetical protein